MSLDLFIRITVKTFTPKKKKGGYKQKDSLSDYIFSKLLTANPTHLDLVYISIWGEKPKLERGGPFRKANNNNKKQPNEGNLAYFLYGTFRADQFLATALITHMAHITATCATVLS